MSVAPVARSRHFRVGPQHHGKRMSLASFAYADAEPGHLYELENGVVVVSIPRLPHDRVVQFIRDLLGNHRLAHPESVDHVSGGTGSVMRMWEMESERHPDITIYLSPPPTDSDQPWDEWTPDIVIEVVSDSSRDRDYRKKPKDYLAAGVRQYWIIDPLRKSATVLTRRGDRWNPRKLGPTATIRTGLLPGFVLRLAAVFAAARK